MSADGPRSADAATPTSITVAAVLVVVQAVGLLAVAVFVAVKSVTSRTENVALSALIAVFAMFAALLLALLARGLRRRRAWTRSPLVVFELLCLPVGYSLAFQGDPTRHPRYGVPVLTLALAVLYCLATPQARAALRPDED